jgi:hypothetical protein
MYLRLISVFVIALCGRVGNTLSGGLGRFGGGKKAFRFVYSLFVGSATNF